METLTSSCPLISRLGDQRSDRRTAPGVGASTLPSSVRDPAPKTVPSLQVLSLLNAPIGTEWCIHASIWKMENMTKGSDWPTSTELTCLVHAGAQVSPQHCKTPNKKPNVHACAYTQQQLVFGVQQECCLLLTWQVCCLGDSRCSDSSWSNGRGCINA